MIGPDSEDSDSSSSEEEGVDSDDSDAARLTSLQATLKSLETHLCVEPNSIPTWLSLLSHTISTIPFDSKNAPKARSEVALSVLSRAFAAHPDNAKSEQLLLKYIHAGEGVWAEDALRAEWERALRPGSTELWIQWLDWRVRTALRNVESIVEDAQRVLAALGPNDENGRLRAFWRIAIAMRDAGEHARLLYRIILTILPGRIRGTGKRYVPGPSRTVSPSGLLDRATLS